MVQREELDINELLGINDYTMPNADFPDPNITCCFVSDTKIYVNLFHNYSFKHYHFIWDFTRRQLVSKHVEMKLECT